MATRTLALPDIADALRRMKRDDELVTRPARRTLKQMLPGYERQPILRLAPHVAYDPAPTTATVKRVA
ncbi:hypothetical protein ACF06X_33190 [Streptomyces sp. NPDC015346]|uniref:hypothetical protein n=1 Tax=Streptomyces sp. NPDC015346 TaxID=3364954 RepID=UPI003702D4C9